MERKTERTGEHPLDGKSSGVGRKSFNVRFILQPPRGANTLFVLDPVKNLELVVHTAIILRAASASQAARFNPQLSLA